MARLDIRRLPPGVTWDGTCGACKGELFRPPTNPETGKPYEVCQRCTKQTILAAHPELVEVPAGTAGVLDDASFGLVTRFVGYWGTCFSLYLAPRWVKTLSEALATNMTASTGATNFYALKLALTACAHDSQFLTLCLAALTVGGPSALYSFVQARVGAPDPGEL